VPAAEAPLLETLPLEPPHALASKHAPIRTHDEIV
jgi:hypothetical protein